MFIVWGTKVVRKKLGRMAEYCPMCRSPRAFLLQSIETVGHLYYIPLGSRTLQGYSKACENCGLALEVFEGDLESTIKGRGVSLDELTEAASPPVAQRIQKRLAWDQQIKERKLDPAAHRELLQEPFVIAETLYQSRSSQTNLDKASGLGCFLSIVIPVLILVLMPKIWTGDDQGFLVVGLVAGLLATLTLFLLATDGRRYVKRTLVPMIVRSLLPMNPTKQELEETLEMLKEAGFKIAKRVDATQISEALRTADAWRDPLSG